MKQTAVEWFFSELERMQYFIGNDMLQAYKQAKEMEKQQIIDAYVKKLPIEDGIFTAIDKGKQYYNEKFNK